MFFGRARLDVGTISTLAFNRLQAQTATILKLSPPSPPPPNTLPDYHIPVDVFVVCDFKAQCGIIGRGGVGSDSFCPRCHDDLKDRHKLFEILETQDGETIESIAGAYKAFPEDLWAINDAGHRDCKERSAAGLKGNTGGTWADEDPDPNMFWKKTGFQVEADDPTAPEDHLGPNAGCKCSICLLDSGIFIRVFRQCDEIMGTLRTSLFPINILHIVIDPLHCIM